MVNAYHWYKLARILYLWKIPLFPKIIKAFIFYLHNSSIPFEAEIGKGSRFAYGGIGVVIHKKAKIGENVLIGQNVTIGGRSGIMELPVIKNNVYLAAGCKILGNITIGEFAVIGANAVVLRDIPSYSIAAGVPARIIRLDKSEKNEAVRLAKMATNDNET